MQKRFYGFILAVLANIVMYITDYLESNGYIYLGYPLYATCITLSILGVIYFWVKS